MGWHPFAILQHVHQVVHEVESITLDFAFDFFGHIVVPRNSRLHSLVKRRRVACQLEFMQIGPVAANQLF